MKHISILIPNEAVLASIEDPRYLFTAANEFLESTGQKPMFQVQLVGLTKEVKLHNGAFTVHADALIHEVRKTDLIFIPALFGDMKKALAANEDLLPWIIAHHKRGTEVASLCIGAFVLASTGLLDGKKCSTHWRYANQFREMFPDVELVDDRIITEENGIYTSGGANSYWNLLLHLLEKYTSRDIAIFASKVFAVEFHRTTQSAFIMFNGQKGHEDIPVKKAQEFIENNVAEKISVEDLADKFAIGKRHFERRFKKATNNTPVEYIQRVKVEAAKRSLETSRKNINEVMFDVGYSDSKAFRSVFKKITGLSPIDYRNRYNKEFSAALV